MAQSSAVAICDGSDDPRLLAMAATRLHLHATAGTSNHSRVARALLTRRPTAYAPRREGTHRRKRLSSVANEVGARAQPSRRAMRSGVCGAMCPGQSRCSSLRLHTDSWQIHLSRVFKAVPEPMSSNPCVFRPSAPPRKGGALDVIPIGTLKPTLPPVGGAGGVGAAGHRRKQPRAARSPIAGVHASDTALAKAGVARGRQEERHKQFRANHEQRVAARLPSREQIAIRQIARKTA
jgi:hypothetical protein